MVNTLTVTGLILAGGAAQRMGGKDKGWQLYRGEPLVSYAVAALLPLCQRLVISANRNLEQYRQYSDCVVTDLDNTTGIGPLGGILAALEKVDTSHLLVLPCDTPNISTVALAHLLEQAKQHPSKVHYLVTESGFQPLHAVLPVKEVSALLADYLAQTERYGVMGFYRKVGCVEVAWAQDKELENINYTEQLGS